MSDYIVRVKTQAPRSQTLGLLAEFWNTDSPQSSLQELAKFLFGRIARGTFPGILSVEVQANDVQGVGPIIIEPGRRPFPASGQPAIGWVIVATSGNTVLTVGAYSVTQAFVTSQAVTAAMLIQQINQQVAGGANVGSLISPSLDPNGVAGKVILTADTLPWDHIIGNGIALSVTGTGTSVSGAFVGASGVLPAAIGANALYNGINL